MAAPRGEAEAVMVSDHRILVDWICYGAETDWWACYRPWSTRGMSWATWHVARFDATGDQEELARAVHHISREEVVPCARPSG